MALKAGLVGVNPDILDNSDRVTALTDGNKKLTFVYDEASDQPGFKINDGDFRPFEKAGVTCMGWVKPADLSQEGLTASSDIEIASGGYTIDDGKVIIDIVIRGIGIVDADTTRVSGFPVSALHPQTTIPLVRCESSTTLEDALASYYTYEGTPGTYRSYYHERGLKMSYPTAAGRYYHTYGMYPAAASNRERNLPEKYDPVEEKTTRKKKED